ncbi:hypothetical protein Taro_008562 [Colocasia esculenta]|uniref:Uncharacterized protein n=1 Tax=Colocasia esculenta TaxID=4460 RepID=A0A843U293_COLES|nr:hypothetical protein [Colocasia esculenta]
MYSDDYGCIKARSSELAIEECDRVIAEYRDSEELNEEVDKLFKVGYDHCVERIRELHPEYDLLGLGDPEDAERDQAAFVITEAQGGAAEEAPSDTVETVASDKAAISVIETQVVASDDVVVD